MEKTLERYRKRMNTLIKTAEAQENTLEYSEIFKVFARVEIDGRLLDGILEYLEKRSVVIIRTEDEEEDICLLMEPEGDFFSEDETAKRMNGDILEGVSMEDPVRLYLKEIGSEPVDGKVNLPNSSERV